MRGDYQMNYRMQRPQLCLRAFHAYRVKSPHPCQQVSRFHAVLGKNGLWHRQCSTKNRIRVDSLMGYNRIP